MASVWIEFLSKPYANEDTLVQVLEELDESEIEDILESGELTDEREEAVRRAIARKRRNERVDATFDLLTRHCTLAKGHELSLEYRDQQERNTSLVYGELPLQSLRKIFATVSSLDKCKAALSGTFVDLGSGSGKVVLAAALLESFHSVTGIEIVPELHDMATELQASWADTDWADKEAWKPKMKFLCGDFINEHRDVWTGADLVLAHCTCFSVPLLQAMVHATAELKEGCIFITSTIPMEAEWFEHLAHIKVFLSPFRTRSDIPSWMNLQHGRLRPGRLTPLV